MKSKIFFSNAFLLLCSFLLFSNDIFSQQNPFEKIKTIPEKLQPLSFGEIKPTGWLLKQIQENLNGFTGHLDSLVPDLIIKDDIYGKDRLTKNIKSKDVGAVVNKGEDWQVQFLWWNSESQSNWWDGFIRSAILANDKKDLQRIKKHVQYILSTQDSDGYLGIYDKDLRYKFNNENGELWAKTTLLRGLLAWYEYTKDKKVLTAIERAVQNVMDNYRINASHPFYSVNPNVGGLSHGLVFTDVLRDLYRITKNEKYLDYSLFLYKDFSEQTLNEDAQYKKLLDTSLALNGHGVHVYEHVRPVAEAYYISGNPQLQQALNNFLYKIKNTTTISGAGIGDEWIGKRKANETTTGYEYCSLQELMNSYESLFIKSANAHYGDKIEKLFFNAAQGSRNPQASCIAYLKSDNSYFMTGGLNTDSTVKGQTRYKYSPVHQDVAVCCVPNAGRIAPYYVQNMWAKEGNDLMASLLGPCELKTFMNGKNIFINEKTNYPFGNTITFEVEGQKASFAIKIRKPSWADKFSVSESYKEENGFIIIQKKWSGKQTVMIKFFPEVKTEQDANNEYYFTYGPLVLAHSIKAITDTTKYYPLPGFYDLKYSPQRLVVYKYDGGKIIQPSKEKLLFTASLFNPITYQQQEIELKPIGETILRQVTFKRK